MKKEQNPIDNVPQNKIITKSKIEWLILGLLITLIVLGVWSNIFAYEYYYFKCDDKPTEIAGKYYRIPGDKGYGIHPGSDYSNCSYAAPPGAQRDPSTKAGAGIMKRKLDEAVKISKHKVYIPKGYQLSNMAISKSGDDLETRFYVTTNTNNKFSVHESKKGSIYDYTVLCSKPAEENWSGTVIGQDSKGRTICKTNTSKYVKDYFVGIVIGETSIMLRSPNISTDTLDAEAKDIFSSMELSQSR